VQFFISEQGYSPLQSGIRILPWTAMPLLFAPIAGALYNRIGGGRIIGVGLTLQAAGLAWIATVSSPTVPYSELIAAFFLAGTGMGLFFGAIPSLVLSSVRRQEEGQASGANNAIRELGGVFGVAVLASIFAHYGGYRTAETFSTGMNAAVYVGAAVVALGALAAFLIPRQRKAQAEIAQAMPAFEEAA
jgi:MFS family permease